MREAEDQVWEQLIESKPRAADWRNVPIPNYDKMVILYRTDRRHTLNKADLVDAANKNDNVGSQHDINRDHFEALELQVVPQERSKR
ncbi:hypothetical protein K1719_004153 [Acacia pycnantha]|nr:hypothetical protein K1719_004153 [Acacia pycnantha]